MLSMCSVVENESQSSVFCYLKKSFLKMNFSDVNRLWFFFS